MKGSIILGYLDPRYFLDGRLQLKSDAALSALESLGAQLERSVVETAFAVHRVVNENMAAAARLHAIERGTDPRRYPLLCLGGAGPVHATGVAEAIGCQEVIVPRHTGVGSALGLLVGPLAYESIRSYPSRLEGVDWATVEDIFMELEVSASDELFGLNDPKQRNEPVGSERSVSARFEGQLHDIVVRLGSAAVEMTQEKLRQAFVREYELLYGHVPGELGIELLTLQTTVYFHRDIPELPRSQFGIDDWKKAAKGERLVLMDAKVGYESVPILERSQMTAGMALPGPAIIEDAYSTVVVKPSMSVTVDEWLNLRVKIETRVDGDRRDS